MNGIGILLLLILTAALPAILVFFWFRARKMQLTLPWFLASLAAGIVSLLAASMILYFIPPPARQGGLGLLFFDIFIRIALMEETSRLVTLVPLLKAAGRRRPVNENIGPALGLAAGLGFAALESASYGMADINITLLRAFTAAPLHGACGIRAGAAVSIAKSRPLKALGLFISAVIIHGAYNLMIVNPAFPSVLAIPTALAALFASLPLVKSGGRDEAVAGN